ncbi:MAG: MFS transporter, partial [Casimicrobiaceae bacterium]
MPWAGNPTLYAMISLGIVNHIVLTGNRVTVSLEALRLGASTAVVGVLLALYALLPMFCAVAAGRLSDRVGVRRPMLVGSIGLTVGSALPVVMPGFISLFFSAVIVGVSFMLFQVPAQNATGELGGVEVRAQNFSLLALGYSISGFFGPLIAGLTIDHGGFTAAFAVFAVLPLLPVAVLASGRLALPGPHPARGHGRAGSALALLMHVKLRRVFFVNVMLAMGWDLHTIVIPVYGA